MLSPIVIPAPVVYTACAALLLAAWWLNHWLAAPIPAYPTWKPEPVQPVGRHRATADRPAYRPRPAAARPGPVVIPSPDPLSATERAERMVPMPVGPPAWRSDDTEVLEVAMPDPIKCEDWATNPATPVVSTDTPEDWFGVPNDDTVQLDAIQ